MQNKNLPIAERADQQEIQPVQPSMITPAGTIDQTIEQFNLYQQLKQKLADKADFQNIKGKPHPKKSFVRKVQRFFNLSCEILDEKPLKDEKGEMLSWIVTVRATHLATGSYQDGDGACDFAEKRSKKQPATIHNVRAHAVTRAKNRAILDLVGFGDVSAEEIPQSDYDKQPSNQGYSKRNPQPQPEPEPTNKKMIEQLRTKWKQGGGKEQVLIDWVKNEYNKRVEDLTESEIKEIISKIKPKQTAQPKQNTADAKRKTMFGIGGKLGLNQNQIKKLAYHCAQTDSLTKMTVTQFDDVIKLMSSPEITKRDLLQMSGQEVESNRPMTKAEQNELIAGFEAGVNEMKMMGANSY